MSVRGRKKPAPAEVWELEDRTEVDWTAAVIGPWMPGREGTAVARGEDFGLFLDRSGEVVWKGRVRASMPLEWVGADLLLSMGNGDAAVWSRASRRVIWRAPSLGRPITWRDCVALLSPERVPQLRAGDSGRVVSSGARDTLR